MTLWLLRNLFTESYFDVISNRTLKETHIYFTNYSDSQQNAAQKAQAETKRAFTLNH